MEMLAETDDRTATSSNWYGEGLDAPYASSTTESPQPDSKVRKSKSSARPVPSLACFNCRPKKVKCQVENGTCRRCLKLGLECFIPTEDERRLPSSKKVIRELQNRIKSLEDELRVTQEALAEQSNSGGSRKSSISARRSQPGESPSSINASSQDSPLSLLARLCSGQDQLNVDSAGQLRFFGPTSSLHVTESVTSSILNWDTIRSRPTTHWQNLLSPSLQNELLELYWTFQNPVLQVVHKEAFLEGMLTGSQYFSDLLLCCILASAARISDSAEVRALALAGDEIGEEDVPYFVKIATTLLEQELRRPSITTVQSLLLLSVADCANGNDTKGWLYAGDACRLVFDLGLHRDCQYLTTVLSAIDMEVRNLVFWACFSFDVLWSLYLGRPRCIRLTDVSIPQLLMNPTSGEFHLQMAAAWSRLLEIVGCISELLNGNDKAEAPFSELVRKLENWRTDLPPTLQYHPTAHPTVFILHMQYSSAQILLQRPRAGFGDGVPNPPPNPCTLARRACIDNAVQISHILTDYQIHKGSCIAMSGVALHTIATAATTLIAEIVEGKADTMATYLSCLKECLRSLTQLEKSYQVTKRVRKIIQVVMRLLNLDARCASLSIISPALPPQQQSTTRSYSPDLTSTQTTNIGSLASIGREGAGLQDLWVMSETGPFMVEDFMFPASAQSAQCFLSNFEPVLGRMEVFQ